MATGVTLDLVRQILKVHDLELEDLTLFCSQVILLGTQDGAWNLCCIAYDETFGFSRLACQSREAPEGIWYRFQSGLLNIVVQRRHHKERFFQSPVGQEALVTGRWIHDIERPHVALKASGIHHKNQ